MPVKLRNFLAVLLVVAVIGVGVLIGEKVSAAGADPGSQGDPLVAKSYVDTQIAGIVARLTKLESEVAQLQKNSTSSSSSTQTSSTVKTGVITGTYVNIRSGPGTGYKIITVLYKDNSAQVVGSQSGWYQIKLANGTVGWVAGWLFAVK